MLSSQHDTAERSVCVCVVCVRVCTCVCVHVFVCVCVCVCVRVNVLCLVGCATCTFHLITTGERTPHLASLSHKVSQTDKHEKRQNERPCACLCVFVCV